MTTRQLGYDGVVLAAPTSVPYERFSERSAHWFFGRLLHQMLEGSGFEKNRIDGLSLTSFSLSPDNATGVADQLGLSLRWLDDIPFGGASGIVALRRAARAVQCGDAAVVACLAADTNQRESFRANTSGFSQFSQDAVYPYGSGGPNASFAFLTDHYMRTFGVRPEDFGAICIAQRDNARANPSALFRTPLSMEDYLAAPMIADPIRLFDCVMPCAGAEGFLVMREDIAAAHGVSFARLLAANERHNPYPDDPIQIRGGWAEDSDELFELAGVAREEIDVVQLYDDYPVMVMMQLEDLGFCNKGAARDFVAAHDLRIRGTFPLNTSGGQLSVGQAGAAGGFLGLVETIRQLTGDTLGEAVPTPRIGLSSGFGMMNYDRGLCSGAAILSGSS